jgi:type IV pilus assembly protein PilV
MSKPDGYTLIEALLALCILSIAAIGVAGLQWQAFSTIRQAALQGEALALAADIAERLRSLPQPASLFFDSDALVSADAAGCADPACAAAAADLREWSGRLRARLPAARARICADAAPWDSARGGFSWDCRGAGPLLVKLGWRENSAAESAPRLVLAVGGGDR